MKRMITSSKQVGKIYYLVDSLESVYSILQQKQIRVSSKKEKPAGSDGVEYFVSFTRNYNSLYNQNPTRWHCGIILDGDILSEMYSISPIHYSGTALSHTSDTDRYGGFKLKQVTAWADGTFDIRFVGWQTSFEISRSCYNAVVSTIEDLDDKVKQRCRLVRSEGKVKSAKKGCKYIERFLFDTPGGAPPSLLNHVSDRAKKELLDVTDQHEERLHGPRFNSSLEERFQPVSEHQSSIKLPYVHISDAVSGLLLNSDDFSTDSESLNIHNEKLVEQCEALLTNSYSLDSYLIEYI